MKFINNHASAKNVSIAAILLLISYLFLNAIEHPVSIKSIIRLSEGYTILNLLPYYDAAIAYEHLNAYTEEAIQIYQRVLVFDLLLLIPVYVSFFSLGLSYFGRTLIPGKRRIIEVATFLPLIAGVLNIVENAIGFILLESLPNQLLVLATWSGFITTVKSSIISISLFSVIFMFLITLGRKVTMKVSTS